MVLNKINGSLCFTKVLENGETEKIYDSNSLTSLFENVILANSISSIFSSLSGSEAGLVSAFTPCRYIATGTSYLNESLNKDSLPTIYLLNLTPEEQAALNKDMVMNPLFASDTSIDMSKVVGWASFDYVGTEDKRGTLTPQVDTLRLSPVVDGTKFGVSFKWAAGKMNGTFNTVILGTNIFTNKLNSVSLAKGVDIMNPAIGEGAASGDFLCPNVQTTGGVVMTGPNEILLGDGNEPTKARRVLNLLTGESVELLNTDPRYNAYLFSEPHTYIGNGRILLQSSTSTFVYNYLGTSTSANTTLSNASNGFAIWNNLIFIKNNVSSSCIFSAYDMNTLSRFSEEDITVTLDTSIFGTDFRGWYLSNFHDKFMLIKANNADALPDKAVINGYVFSDLTNVMGSFKGGYNGNIGTNIEIVDTEEAITDYVYVVFRTYNEKPVSGAGDYVYPPSGIATSVLRNGVKLVFNEGYYGQVFTYATLEQPVSIGSTEGLILDYMFHF